MRFLAVVGLSLLAACAPTPTQLSHFDGEVSFDYPSSWNAAKFDIVSNFRFWIVFLSTEPLSDPCTRTSMSIDCGGPLIDGELRPDGILANWTSNGFPTWAFEPNAGDPITVGGIQGTLEHFEADTDCVAVGGDTNVRVILPSIPRNWTEFDACVVGPFDGAIRDQIMAMLDSVGPSQ